VASSTAESYDEAFQALANAQTAVDEITNNAEFAGKLGDAFEVLGQITNAIDAFNDTTKFLNAVQTNDLQGALWHGGLLILDFIPEYGLIRLGLHLAEPLLGFGGSGGSSGGGGTSSSKNSLDPNAMLGPAGYGPQNFVADGTPLPYQIDFENAPTATAPAQQVVITDTLDPNLDLSTFQFTEIAFGDTMLMVPPGSQFYQTSVPVTDNGQTFDVDIVASLDSDTRQVTVKFQSIDPSTDLPPNVLAGFLPPENGTGRGQGFVSYTIQPLPGLATGTQIRNVATIVFDGNTPIATDQVSDEDPSQGIDPTKQALITIDNTVPTSTVAALPATESSASFTVSWSGSDGDGLGIQYYNVYVSDDGGAFTLFQANTTATSATFAGQLGHTYGFYSVATSNVGLTQPTPAGAQASTTIVASLPAVLQFAAAQFAANVTGGVAQVVISRAGNLGASLTVTLSSPGGHDVTAFSETVTIGPNVTSQIVTIPISNDGQPGESNTIIPLTLSSPGAGATLGAATTASLVIHDDNPFPPPVAVESVRWETIKVKVGNGRRARTESETVLEIQFSGLVAGTGDLADYQLSSVTTKKVKKTVVTSYKPIRLTSAMPASSPMTSTVSLLPAIKPNLSQSDRIQIDAADLTDVYGRPLDGNDDGVPGGNYVAIVTKHGVIPAAVASPATMAARAVDAVLEKNGLLNAVPAHRGRNLGRFGAL
jgi:hypothetical protein